MIDFCGLRQPHLESFCFRIWNEPENAENVGRIRHVRFIAFARHSNTSRRGGYTAELFAFANISIERIAKYRV